MASPLLVLLFLFSFSLGVKQKIEVRVRVPQGVRAGSTAILLCQFDTGGRELYSVKWYRGQYEFFRYLPKNIPPAKAFPIPGIEVDIAGSSKHQVSLLSVPRNISGRFSCEVSAEGPRFETAIDSANLTILDVRIRKPVLLLSKSEFQPGTELSVNCSAEDIEPSPSFSFYINNNKVDGKWVHQLSTGLASLSEEALTDRLAQRPSNAPLQPLWIGCVIAVMNVRLSSEVVPVVPVLDPPGEPDNLLYDYADSGQDRTIPVPLLIFIVKFMITSM